MAVDSGRIQVVDAEDRFADKGVKPPLELETGSGFGWADRMFFGFSVDNPELVFQYTDWASRDLVEFLRRDYKARQIMNVLQLPITSAEHTFSAAKGDTGELEWLQSYWEQDPVNGGCRTPLDYIISQATTAIAHKAAYFEKVFKQDDDGKVVYDKVAFRPQTTCHVLRDIDTASFQGFQQEPYYLSMTTRSKQTGNWINIPKERAYVYLHGQHTDPVNGVSDMDVPYWCYQTKQKVMLLWFQFLEGVALPRAIVKAQDIGVARQIAAQLSRLRNSGVIPVAAPGANTVSIDTLSMEGNGATQFQAAITFLDSSAVDSVLAGFLNLTGTAAARGLGNGGSYALSKDASDFFLQAEEAKTKELARSLRKDLHAPLIRYNFGKKAVVPHFEFEPLNDEDKSNSITLLQAMIAAPPGSDNPVPTEMVGALAKQVGDYLGLDGDKLEAAFAKASSDAKAAAAAQSAAGAAPPGQAVAGMAGATNAASTVMKTAQGRGQGPSSIADAGVTSEHGVALLKSLGVPA